MKQWTSIVLLLMVFYTNQAQEVGENQLGAWYMYSGSHRVSNKVSISSAIQLWDYEPTYNFNLFLVLTGVNYALTSNVTATMGYGYATIDRSFENIPNEDLMREHRLYEQMGFKSTLSKLQIGQRYRIEHRFLNDANTTKLRHRNRYRLQLTLPLTDTFFMNVYDEIIWYFEKDLFNQNRLYAALGICITPNSKLELGYLKHHFSKESYDRLQVSIAIKTDFRKHKKLIISNYDATTSIDKNEILTD